MLIILLSISLLLFNACDGRKGSLNVNQPPIVSITNYFGVDDPADIADAEIFQQTISWSGYDVDGVIQGYAFRVLNQDGVPITTPGYEVLDDDGWVKHYTPNADTNIPLDQSQQTTIWYDFTYATINFPAADANLDSANVISEFQVKCVDDRGDESAIASKHFMAYSSVPRVTIQSSKGIIDGKTIGLGVVIQFTIPVNTDLPSVMSEPYYFLYKIEKRDLDGNVIPQSEGGYPDEWFSTYGTPDIEQVTLTSQTSLQILPNTFNEAGTVPSDSTFLFARGVSIAGIQSEISHISFLVKDTFAPGTIIYYGENAGQKNDIYALGQHHFSTYLDESMSVIVPSIETSDGIHNATAFWVNQFGEYELIGSQDIKIYMHWGWHGEFEDNNPFKRRSDQTLDELTNTAYFSEITHFDLRFDGEPVYYPPLPATGNNLAVDDDGTEWLRVPVNNPIGQRITLNTTIMGGIDNIYNDHVFEARAVDLQGVADPTPHSFNFRIVQPVSAANKTGVMIIDDEVHHPQNAPGDSINSLYNYFVSEIDTDPGYLNRNDIKTLMSNVWGLDQLHFGKSVLSPTDFQQYRTVIYHSDNPVVESNLNKEFESLKIYLLQGGNVIVSAGANLRTVQFKLRQVGFPLFEEYFGIPLSEAEPIIPASNAFNANPFMIGAYAEFGSQYDINLQLPSFNATISHPNPMLSLNGFGPLSYFDTEAIEAEVIYRYMCKEPGIADPGIYHINPTQEEFDTYNNLPIAIKKVNSNNTCYLFGFPLAYMVKDDVKNLMNNILNQLGH